MLLNIKDNVDYKRIALKALGGIWFVDGLLQLQPYMFSKKFATDMLAGTAQGQPHFVESTVTEIANFLTPHIVVWNALFAIVQLAIGLGILYNKTAKLALGISFVWVFGVWWFGEAFGQVFSGNASLLTGAPGAVLLYGLIGLILWPRRSVPVADLSLERNCTTSHIVSISSDSVLSENLIKLMWALVWVMDGVLQFLPSNSGKGDLVHLLQNQAGGEPRFFASINSHLASIIQNHGVEVAFSLGIVEIVIGIGVYLKRQNYFIDAGLIFSLVVWITVQDLGGIFTGQGTDPNSGLLLVLFAVCLYQFKRRGIEAHVDNTVDLDARRHPEFIKGASIKNAG